MGLFEVCIPRKAFHQTAIIQLDESATNSRGRQMSRSPVSWFINDKKKTKC
jgi:hypothetical protein